MKFLIFKQILFVSFLELSRESMENMHIDVRV